MAEESGSRARKVFGWALAGGVGFILFNTFVEHGQNVDAAESALETWMRSRGTAVAVGQLGVDKCTDNITLRVRGLSADDERAIQRPHGVDRQLIESRDGQLVADAGDVEIPGGTVRLALGVSGEAPTNESVTGRVCRREGGDGERFNFDVELDGGSVEWLVLTQTTA